MIYTLEPFCAVKTDKMRCRSPEIRISLRNRVNFTIDSGKLIVLLGLLSVRIQHLVMPPAGCVARPDDIFSTERHGTKGLEAELVLADPFLGSVGIHLQDNPHAATTAQAGIGYDSEIFVCAVYVEGIQIKIVADIVRRKILYVFLDMLLIRRSSQLVDRLVGGVLCNGGIIGIQVYVRKLHGESSIYRIKHASVMRKITR